MTETKRLFRCITQDLGTGLYSARYGVVDGSGYFYFPDVPVKQNENPRLIRLDPRAIYPAEWDIENAGEKILDIELPKYIRLPKVKRVTRALFQQDHRGKVTILGAKGQEITTVTTVRFVERHSREQDPSPRIFTDEQRHAYNLKLAEEGDRLQGIFRGTADRQLARDENNEALQMLSVARDLLCGDELDKLAGQRLQFGLMQQTADSFREWSGLSERYLAHLDRYVSRWWKGSLYPRSTQGFVTHLSERPKNSDRIIRRGLRDGRIPAALIRYKDFVGIGSTNRGKRGKSLCANGTGK